jgi:hypothetical protein
MHIRILLLDVYCLVVSQFPSFVLQRPRYRGTGDYPGSSGTEPHRHDQRKLHSLCQSCKGVFDKSRIIHGSRLNLVRQSEKFILHTFPTDFSVAITDGCRFAPSYGRGWDLMAWKLRGQDLTVTHDRRMSSLNYIAGQARLLRLAPHRYCSRKQLHPAHTRPISQYVNHTSCPDGS